jgi:hypothetical protein
VFFEVCKVFYWGETLQNVHCKIKKEYFSIFLSFKTSTFQEMDLGTSLTHCPTHYSSMKFFKNFVCFKTFLQMFYLLILMLLWMVHKNVTLGKKN